MLSCLNITVETVVPAVLKSPILFLFQVSVNKDRRFNSDVCVHTVSYIHAHKKTPPRWAPPLLSKSAPLRRLEGADKVNSYQLFIMGGEAYKPLLYDQ